MKKCISLLVFLALMLPLAGCKYSDYQKAQDLAENGDYDDAIAVYQELGDYKDS